MNYGRSGQLGLAAGLAIVAMLTGCSKQPGGQVVAVVNNQDITQQELQAQAVSDGIPSNTNFKAVAPGILERVIQRNLLADYARDQGLDRSPGFVARRRLMEQTMLAGMALEKLAGQQPAPTPAQINAYITANPTLFAKREELVLDQLRFATPNPASKVGQLSSLTSLDLAEARLRRMGVPVSRAEVRVDTGALAPQIASQIVSLPPGTLFDISANGVSLISTIKSRAPIGGDPSSWNAIAASAVAQDTKLKAASARLEELRKAAKVTVAPEYKLPAGKTAQ